MTVFFGPFTDHPSKRTIKRVVFHRVQSNAAVIAAMRSGRLHVGGFSTGPTNSATHIAGLDRFFPITYKKDWEIERKVATGIGEIFTRAAFERLAKKSYDKYPRHRRIEGAGDAFYSRPRQGVRA